MRLRIISPTMHGVIDYSAAMALIAGPMIFGLGSSSPLAIWISISTGIAVVLVSVSTQYAFSLFKVIPFDIHLGIDLLAATSFLLAPLLFDFTGIDFYYYIVNAAVVYLVVALSDNSKFD